MCGTLTINVKCDILDILRCSLACVCMVLNDPLNDPADAARGVFCYLSTDCALHHCVTSV